MSSHVRAIPLAEGEHTVRMQLHNRDILYNNAEMGPYPIEQLKRVDHPTNLTPGPIERRSQLKHAQALAKQGVYGKRVQVQAKRIIEKYPIGGALFEVRNHLKKIDTYKNKVAAHQAPLPGDPRVLSRHFKSLGYFLGADLMAVCRVPPSSVYLDDELGNPLEVALENAIIFVKRKHLKTTFASSGYDWIFDSLSIQTYQLLALWTDTVANYIRRLGYNAEVSNMRNYLTLLPPLLLEAGIGEISRMGIVLNPFFGANYKAAAVLTDLPLDFDRPVDFGLQAYCETCTICSDQCPSKAVAQGKKTLYNGYETWKVDFKKCVSFGMFNKVGSVCGRCTKVCPWNRPDSEPHHFASWDGDPAYLYQSVNARAKRLYRDGFVDPTEMTNKWWFDLEEVNGRIVIPKSSR